MKKVMFVLISLLLVSFCFAQSQSGPSNTVGYVKIVIGSGTQVNPAYASFGLPFKFWDVPVSNIPTYGVESYKPEDIIGAQANCGLVNAADRIQSQNYGSFAYRNSASSCNWTGSLQTGLVNMIPGKAYFYVNKSGVARNLVLAGQVDNSGSDPNDTLRVPANSYAPVSWRDSRDVPRNQLNLLANGFLGGNISTSDRVFSQADGTFFWYNTSNNTWQGVLAGVSPGVAYRIQNKHAAAWTYNYDASGNPLTSPENAGDPAIQVIRTGKSVSASNNATE